MTDICFVCAKQTQISRDSTALEWLVDCGRCGRYRMRWSVQEDLKSDPDAGELLPYLSAHIRQNAGSDRWLQIGADWKDLARAHARTPIAQKRRMLLEAIGRGSKFPGDRIELDEAATAPVIDAKDEKEMRYLLEHLVQLGYVSMDLQYIPARERTSQAEDLVTVRLEVAGWEAISPLAGVGLPGTCFVAMSFDPVLNDAYEQGIVAAVKDDCGFDVIRIDRVPHNDDITDRILAGIRTAQFVVADFTDQKPGVYFEAGFAAGLGRTVIWTCHKSDFEKLHFDTRQRNHIKWQEPSDLRQQLAERIRATVSLPARL